MAHGIQQPKLDFNRSFLMGSVRGTRCGRAYEALPWCVAWDQPGRYERCKRFPFINHSWRNKKLTKQNWWKVFGGHLFLGFFVSFVQFDLQFINQTHWWKQLLPTFFVKHLHRPGDLWKTMDIKNLGLASHRVYFRKTRDKKNSLDPGLVTDIHITSVPCDFSTSLQFSFLYIEVTKTYHMLCQFFCLGKHLHSISYVMSHLSSDLPHPDVTWFFDCWLRRLPIIVDC